MPDLPITGGCLCGAVRYAIDAPLYGALYCHCTRCQRRSGCGASANARVEPGAFRLTSGAELVRCYRPPTGFEKCFCSICGSALFSRHPEHHDDLAIRLGGVDGDPGVRPEKRQFVAYAAAWEPVPDDGLPRHEESSRRPTSRTPPPATP